VSRPYVAVSTFKFKTINNNNYACSYNRFCDGGTDMPCSVVNDALSAAFCFGHNPQSQEELLAMLDIDRNGSISLDEFIRAARSSGDVERWLLRLPLTNIVSDAISAAVSRASLSTDDNSLRQLASITPEQVTIHFSTSYSPFSRLPSCRTL
jgi:hypothetical protein